MLEELQAQLKMEYKIEYKFKGKESKKIEFENPQEMFNHIISSWGRIVVSDGEGKETFELHPFSNKGDYLSFFDQSRNVIREREQWEKHYAECELIVNDEEGNRINFFCLDDLINLEGVDSSEITVRPFNYLLNKNYGYDDENN